MESRNSYVPDMLSKLKEVGRQGHILISSGGGNPNCLDTKIHLISFFKLFKSVYFIIAIIIL